MAILASLAVSGQEGQRRRRHLVGALLVDEEAGVADFDQAGALAELLGQASGMGHGLPSRRLSGYDGSRMVDEKNDQGGEDFASLLAASEAQATQRLAVGESVRGRVIALGGGSAFVEIGGKGEAVIDLGEF
ncbi:MAG TPA: hypothetical protein VL049_11900, partial [Candidatus Dormibacteraeota bacterium]|nr:hypothetical protein [Candidatus Dormibacteraeota bacterium]